MLLVMLQYMDMVNWNNVKSQILIINKICIHFSSGTVWFFVHEYSWIVCEILSILLKIKTDVGKNTEVTVICFISGYANFKLYFKL